MKKTGKIIGSITAIVLVGCITITSMTIWQNKEVVEAAKANFSGIEQIAKLNSDTNPFEILELVPDVKMAEFSYMYEVADSWEEDLRTMKGSADGTVSASDARKKYVNESLKTALEGLCKDDTTVHALSYETYEETYVDTVGYKGLEVSTGEIISMGNTEYYMEDSESGDYILDAEYVIGPWKDGAFKGQFRQNVNYYVYAPKLDQYYGVSFEDARDEQRNFTVGVEDLYQVSRTQIISSKEDFDALSENAYIYRLSYADIYGNYEYVGTVGGDYGVTYDSIEADTNHYYYTLRFTHVPADTVLSQNENYYKIKDVTIRVGADGTPAGEYGANPGAIFEKDDNGCFIPKDNSAFNNYKYVGAGNGIYRLVKNTQHSGKFLEHNVIVGKIYYKGGFSNNHLLEKEVFGVADEELPMNIKVTPVTPEMLDKRCESENGLDGVGLLYISSKSLIWNRKNVLEMVSGTSKSYEREANDISWDTAKKIMEKAREPLYRLPIILDRSILDGVNIENIYDNYHRLNIQRMAYLMTSLQFFGTNGTKQLTIDDFSPNSNNSPWGNLYCGGDQFGEEFVNQNIYIYSRNEAEIAKNPYQTPYIFRSFTEDILKKSNNNVSVSNDDETAFLNVADKQGLKEIAEYIIQENKKRKNENNGLPEDQQYEMFPYQISKATIVEYIINFVNQEEVEWNSKIHILEIQPGATKDYKATLDVEKLKQALKDANYDVNDVEVTYMASSEFIGHIEDLSQYDVIYMGLDTYFHIGNDSHTTITTETKYNDSSMNGLIYTNIGDIIGMVWKSDVYRLYVGMLDSDWKSNTSDRTNAQNLHNVLPAVSNPEHPEVLQNATNTFRLAGNDISKEKLVAIQNYVKAGYPLVLNAGFFKENKKDEVNDKYIDNSSNVYELVNSVKSRENVISVSDMYTKNAITSIMKYVMVGKPSIMISDHDKRKNTTDGESNEFFDVKEDTISLSFKVTNQGSADAQQDLMCSFYLDINKDGRFSKKQEKVDGRDIVMKKNGSRMNVSNQTTSEGKEFFYQITPGVTNEYTIEYKLPEGTIGLIPWKLEIGQKDNTLRTVCKQGYFYNIHVDEDEKNQEVPMIHILQIDTSDEKTNDQKKLDDNGGIDQYGTKVESSPASLNMQKELENPDSKFSELKSRLKDFDFDVTTISSDKYIEDYNNYPGENKDAYFEHCMSDGSAADMLVIGFGDCYQIGDGGDQDKANKAANGLIHFINSGKPVLFTHDTTSFHYLPNGKWGYLINSKIRNLVGMDRYGVLSNPYIKAGKSYTKSSDKSVKGDYEKALAYEEAKNKDVPYLPRSGRTKTVRQTQGPTYLMIFHVIKADDKPNNIMEYWPYSRRFMENYVWQKMTTTKVAQINEGQITSYPFYVNRDITVAKTHQQYYQLDLNEDADKDGESDIVVWYSLTPDTAPGKMHPIYSCAPKDVRENYYIYTKGNVTYSGVGHYKMQSNEDELKLYINTIIAAYNAGSVAPKISLKEGADENSNDMNVMYVTFDDTLQKRAEDEQAVADGKDPEAYTYLEDDSDKSKNAVYITVTDANFVRNTKKKVIELSFGIPTNMTEDDYENADKSMYKKIDVEGKPLILQIIKQDSDVVKITSVEGDPQVALSSGVTYKAMISSSILEGNSSEIYVIARTKFYKGNSQYNDDGSSKADDDILDESNVEYSPEIYKSFRMQKIGLIDLD